MVISSKRGAVMKEVIKICICDDQDSFLQQIEDKVREILQDKREFLITKFNNGNELIKKVLEQDADIVLLDIEMPCISGFDVAKELKEKKNETEIIFITGHDDLVFNAWEYQPFWFIRKSHLNELNHVLTRLVDKIDYLHSNSNSIIELKTDKENIKIDVNKIMYIQSHGHYLIIKSPNKEWKIRGKISDAEKQLSSFDFVRIQNSVIVNCRFISKVDWMDVTLSDGEKIRISRNKTKEIKNIFQEYIRSEA